MWNLTFLHRNTVMVLYLECPSAEFRIKSGGASTSVRATESGTRSLYGTEFRISLADNSVRALSPEKYPRFH
jgi:hypothetical protein